MTTRRQFIKSAAAVLAASRLAFGQSRRGRKGSCVVVGAGLSGLAAAFRLKSAGWNVTVLDARERLGGRVFSHSLPENPSLVCELGAEWVGESHERLKQLCADFAIPLQKHQFEDSLMIDGKVSRPGMWGFSPKATNAFELQKKLYDKLTPAQERRIDAIDWWNFLETIGFSQQDLRIRDLMDSTDFGESIRHVSAYAALAEYAESSEKNEMDYKMTGGNSRLVNELAKRVGAENIKLGTKVAEIRQRAGVVTVTTASGEALKADAVVCTAPVASLRKIKFDPPLPAAQSDAAHKLQYARIVKNSVLYSERFWKADDFSMVTDATSHYYFHSTQKQAGTEGILTAYAIGEKADVLASQSDARRMKVIARDLVDFDERAPSLAKGIASYAWQRDEFTEGAYAIYRPGQWFTLRPALAAPHGKVLFAGEHLSDDWQGFMEGAIETGEAAADALIR